MSAQAVSDQRAGFDRPVIILHGIGTPQRTLEPGEEAFWVSHSRFCQILDRIVAMRQDAPEITFDDGNVSDLEIALPELARRGLKASFFLLMGRLGQPGSLAEADVTVLAEAGHHIGLHGADHVDWRQLDAAARDREFVAARDRLSALAGHPVDQAAAPFGLYDRQTLKDLRQLGFAALYTSDRGLAGTADFIRPRNCLEGSMDDAAVNDALWGRVRGLRRVRRVFGVARKRLLPMRLRV